MAPALSSFHGPSLGLFSILFRVLAEPNPPEWPDTVYVYGPEDATSRNLTAEIAELLLQLNNVSTGHYSSERKALLFKPGSYDVEVEVGYYVQVLGLGRDPKDVAFTSRQLYSLYGMMVVKKVPLRNLYDMTLEMFILGKNFRQHTYHVIISIRHVYDSWQ